MRILQPIWSLGLTSLLLTGCAVIGISPQPIDYPLDTTSMSLFPSCLTLPPEHTDVIQAPTSKRLNVMKTGTACWLVVQPGVLPRKPEQALTFDTMRGFTPHIGNGTGLLIGGNEDYEIWVPSSHTPPFWYDLDRKIGTPCGDQGGGITRFMNFTKLHVGQHWFALYATTDNDPDLGQQVPGIVSFLDGELTFYVNDTPYEMFYNNNQGRLLVLIKRLT